MQPYSDCILRIICANIYIITITKEESARGSIF